MRLRPFCTMELVKEGAWFWILLALQLVEAQDPAPNLIDALAGLKSQINTVRSTADLTCESSRMMVNFTFAEPFRGKIFLENNAADAACWLFGTGLTTYQYPIPLKQCGTRQINLREFENTIQIRYGNTDAILLGDERKTVLCRYPPPVVPPIVPIVPPIPAAIPPVPAPSVSELELLLIIAAVLFLGLLLLGLCCGWAFIRRRRAKVVESEGVLIEQPDVMKLSGTTLPFILPRAATSVSDASESGLLQHLEDYPIVPVIPEGEIMRIPHVMQHTRGYELQEASMNVPSSLPPSSEIAEGESEIRDTITDTDLEHTVIFAPPIPARPPSPLSLPFPGKFQDVGRETRSDITETELEHTMIASRIPQQPPPPVRSPEHQYDMRSVSVLSDESITRSVIPMLPDKPPPRPPPKPLTTEMETETHSVVESLENELILRAVPKRQPPLPAPPRRPFYPLDTTTETTVVEETEERYFPPAQPPITRRSDDRMQMDQRYPRQPPPPVTTTQTVSETNIERDFEVYPRPRGPVRQPPRQPPGPITTTTTETDIEQSVEFYPPRRQPPPLKPITTTRTETDVERSVEYYQPRPQPLPKPITTTRTVTETNVERDYETYPLSQRPPQTITSSTRTSDDRREYQRFPPTQPGPTTRTSTTTETNVERYNEFSDYPPSRRPGPGPTTTTRTTRDTDIRRDYDSVPYPGPQTTSTSTVTRDERIYPGRPFSPEIADRTDITNRLDTRTQYDVYPGRGPRGPQRPSTTMRTHRESSRRDLYDIEGINPRDVSISPDYPPDYPMTHTDTFTNTVTRDIQKQIDAGTPPASSGTGNSPEGSTVARPSRTTETLREYSIHRPTTIPRPTVREPITISGTTTERANIRETRTVAPPFGPVPVIAGAIPTYHPFHQGNGPRRPLEWDELYRTIYEFQSDDGGPVPDKDILPLNDIDRLRDLVLYDEDFQLVITRVRTVYDLYYIRYTPPYDTYFVETSWTIIIRVFVITLDLPRPHPDDPEFIEPQPEWFTRLTPPRDLSDVETSSTLTPSSAERALSELTEDIPRMMPRGSVTDSDGSSWFGSTARRESRDAQVSEYFEESGSSEPSRNARTYRGERRTRVMAVREIEEENQPEL